MSSVVWDKGKLIQQAGGNTEELGYVKYDESSNMYILWLKDVRGVFGVNVKHIRGDFFTSMSDARQHAASSTSAFLFHYMWMVGLRKVGAESIEDSISTLNKKMDLMAKEANKREIKSKKREIWIAVISFAFSMMTTIGFYLVL